MLGSSFCWSRMWMWLLLLLVLVLRGWGARVPSADRECGTIGNLIRAKGFTYPWWRVGAGSLFPVSANPLPSTCPSGSSGDKSTKCCKQFNSTTQMGEMGSAFNERWLRPKLTNNADIFKDRKKKFDVTFKDLLTRAHTAFHAMFERTYGMLYIQHAPIFHALFQTLESYYDNGKESLEGKLNEFFSILTRKMFVVLNSQYEFDEAYLSCASIVISEKQGRDIHKQIVSSLRRSFVATRALAQGLNDADRVFNNLHKFKISSECISTLSQMLQCPICSELRAIKPCAAYCAEVTSQCLAGMHPLVKSWGEFTSGMEDVLDRMLGPYNVEAVVEPIHIKISEAIMNFQESGPDLSQAVFGKCGKAKLKSASKTRRKRATPIGSAAALENLRKRPTEEEKSSTDTFKTEDSVQPSKSLEKLLREIKHKVRKSKNIWDILPRQVCNGISKDYSSQMCWNGSAATKPDRNKTSSEESGTVIPTLRAAKGPPNILIMEQVIILQQITEKLRASYHGFDVQWVQDDIDELDFDGSGMGSGSGELPTDLEDDDDDDPSGQITPTRVHNPHLDPNTPRPFSPSPNVPSRLPPILNPMPNHEDEEDEDEGDEDIFSSSNNPNPTDGFGGHNDNDNEGIDFAPSSPKSQPPPIIIVTDPTTTTRRTTISTSTSTTTNRPQVIDVTKTRHPSTSSGTLEEAKKAMAFFKLFSPIVASMLGKAFSFT